MSAILTFIKAFEKVTDKSDKEPPMIVKSEGILIFGFDITRTRGQANDLISKIFNIKQP